MSIRFKCSCGRELSAPEGSAGRKAFCPGCRKSVPVPGELDAAPQRADEREASEFKPGALASLLGGGSPGRSEGEGSAGAEKPGAGAKKEPEKKQEAPPEEERAKKDGGERKPQASPESASGEKRGKPEKSSQPEAAKGKQEVPSEEIKVQPAAETQDVPPPGVEILTDRIKFYCECGQKVAVPLPPPRGAGKCPRCKRRLKVPEVAGAPAGEPAPAAKGGPEGGAREYRHCPKCGRRIEDPGAAFCPRCGFPLALRPSAPREKPAAPPEPQPIPEPAAEAPAPDPGEIRRRAVREASALAADRLRPSPPQRAEEVMVPLAPAGPAGLGRRLGAFLLDLAALGAVAGVAYCVAGRSGSASALAPSALAAMGVFALLNEVVFAAMARGRSLGMVVAGVQVVNHEGRPAGPLLLLARLLASTLLFLGAPLALFDAQKRTLHDIVCGTTVRL